MSDHKEQPRIAAKKPVVEKMEPGTYYWCSCGKSSKQPFCDGSHSDTCFTPVEVKLEEEKVCAWCTCKRSKKGHFCDGSHSKL